MIEADEGISDVFFVLGLSAEFFPFVAEDFVSSAEVGDGDLSFSLALAHAWRAEKSTAELVATVYDSREELLRALELQKAIGLQ